MQSLRLAIALATLELKVANLAYALERRYRPDQPRAPAGTPEGGQWVGDLGGPSVLPPTDAKVAETLSGLTKHGINQVISRGVVPAAILDALQNHSTAPKRDDPVYWRWGQSGPERSERTRYGLGRGRHD